MDVNANIGALTAHRAESVKFRESANVGDDLGEAVRSGMNLSGFTEERIAPVTSQLPIAVLELLNSAGFKPTEENAKMIELLLANRLPADKATLLLLNRGIKLAEGNMEKAVFLLKNQLPLNKDSVNRLNGEGKITAALEEFLLEVDALPEGKLKTALCNIFLPERGRIPAVGPSPSFLASASLPDVSFREILSGKGDKTGEQAPLTGEVMENDGETAVQSGGRQALFGESPDSADKALGLANGAWIENIKRAVMGTGEPVLAALRMPAAQKGMDIPLEKDRIRPFLMELLKDEPVLRNEILKKLEHLDWPERKEMVAGIPRKYLLSRESRGPGEIDKALETLQADIQKAKVEIMGEKGSPRLLALADNLTASVEFMNNAKHNVFMQFPIQINNQAETAEIYVFKDKSRGKSAKPAESAVIGLDLPHLGRFEVYVRKESNGVFCNFGVTGEEAEGLTRGNLPSLETALRGIGYSLLPPTYRRIGEKFGPLSHEPMESEEEKIRYGFDTRA